MSQPRLVHSAASDPRRIVFRAYLGVHELLEVLKPKTGTIRVLDIGGGNGVQARFFRHHGLTVDVVDTQAGLEPLAHEGDYLEWSPSSPYDAIWASHVAEHMPNPGLFFDKLYLDLRDGGWAAITVPPLKHDMTFAHVTLWNAGLLLIHLLRAGFDARDAHVATYGYNVTVIARKNAKRGKGPLKNFLPEVKWNGAYFAGEIKALNWKVDALRVDTMFAEAPLDKALAALKASPPTTPSFFAALDPKTKKSRNFYFDPETQLVCTVG